MFGDVRIAIDMCDFSKTKDGQVSGRESHDVGTKNYLGNLV